MREKAVRLWVLLCPGIVKNLVKDKNLKDLESTFGAVLMKN